MLAFPRVGAHPRFCSAAMTLVACRIDDQVSNHGVAGEWFNAHPTAIFGKVGDLRTVGKHDSTVDADTGCRRA